MSISQKLLRWYDQHRRPLPWRLEPSPYHTLLSEVMLQQTRVDTVLPYYEKFLAHYPTVETLAQAKEEDLHQLWAGLGYYSRARNLKSAAEQIVALGSFPKRYEDLLQLKGIGPYTAGAIASIAFQEVIPAVDGNVLRVYTRLYCLSGDIKKVQTVDEVRKQVQQTMSQSRPGDFNQALMDLGSLVCKVKNPNCQSCPLQKCCQAYQRGEATAYPVKAKAKAKKEEYYLACAYHLPDQEAYYYEPVKEKGLLKGMRLFPLYSLSKAQYQKLQTLLQEKQAGKLSLFESSLEEQLVQHKLSLVGEVQHIFTHKKWHLLLATKVVEPQQAESKTDFYPLTQQKFAICKVQEKLNTCLMQSKKQAD